MEKQFCYLNGKIIPVEKATLPILDISILRGFAIFDSMLAQGLQVLHNQDHMQRFFNSAKEMGMHVPLSRSDLEKTIVVLLKKNAFKSSKVRIVMTGGIAQGPSDIEQNNKHPNIFITVDKFIPFADSVYEKGVSLMTANYQRPFPTVKTTNYTLAVYLQDKKKQKKAFEILYTYDDKVYECTTANFFIVKGKKLITAKDGVLKGITRKFVLVLAKKLGLEVIERDLKTSELKTADEAFITGTYKGIAPVVKIDSTVINKGKVGHAAQELRKLYNTMSIAK